MKKTGGKRAVSPINGQPLPIGRPFQKGNPGGPGRPPNMSILATLRRYVEAEMVKGNDIQQRLVDVGIKMAEEGDFRFWEHIFNRIDGKVADRIAGPEGEPLSIIRFSRPEEL